MFLQCTRHVATKGQHEKKKNPTRVFSPLVQNLKGISVYMYVGRSNGSWRVNISQLFSVTQSRQGGVAMF